MPRTAPSSPFFQPSTPHVVVVQQTPGGTRRNVQQKVEVDENKSSILGCSANLINAIVGSGIVGIPYAIKQAGFGAGVFLILFCALLTEKSLRLLVATAKHVHCPTYETAAEAAYGKNGFRFVAINMFVMAYGAMLSYLMIVKDTFSTMLGIDPDDTPKKRAVLMIVSMAIMVPLSSQRDMADLAWTSRLSVLIDTLMVGIVATHAPIRLSLEQVGGLQTMLFKDVIHWNTVFVGLGVLSFAFVCQHSAFIIAGSLQDPTVKRWSIATKTALLFCVILASTNGICGYLGFQSETQGNVLNNLDPESLTANIARGMLGFTMLFVYPLESFVARHVCVVLLFSGRRAHEGEDSTILNRRDRRVGLTVLLYLMAVIPAALFEELGPVLATTGAIGGSSLSYIGPGLVYLGVHGGRFLEIVQQSWLGSMVLQTPLATSTTAVETTPLLSSIKDAQNASKQAIQRRTDNLESIAQDGIVARFAKSIVWYTSGMFIWCRIASHGKKYLTHHVHDMALKSPHPIRIGDVQYKRAAVSERGTIDAETGNLTAVLKAPAQIWSKDDALPLLAHSLSTPDRKNKAGDINAQIGQRILQQQKEAKKDANATNQDLEPDPQEAPPSAIDFAIAIFYILFGFLALIAGMLSLSNG